MIIATAGHVDHGKTALLARLTGIDADRLPEEKRRGMTIDLGYAYLPLPDGRVLGFIDVPGHERFLATMLAGVGRIDHALLVVAADDGVMPQTREHLAILQLLGVAQLTVALSKVDLADAARLTALHAEVDALLAPTPYAGSARFAVSSTSGAGIDDLRAALIALAEPPRQLAGQRFRLAIDRAFTLTGAGLVVTGSACGGTVRVGDTLWLTGCDTPVRVRSLHAQNHHAEQGIAGQRLALNLVGDVDKQQIARGDWLLAERPPAPSVRVAVSVTASPALEKPLQHWQPLLVHHAARHVAARLVLLEGTTLAAGETGLAELALEAPLHLADGDRLILRDIGARATLAGASVLSLTVPSRAKRSPERLTLLAGLDAAGHDHDAALLSLAERDAVSLDAFGWARQLDAAAVDALTALAQLRRVGQGRDALAYAPERWLALGTALLARLDALHLAEPGSLGAGRARLKRLALPKEADSAVNALIDELLRQGELVNSRGWLHRPGHVLAFSPDETTLWQRLAPLFGDGNEPRWVRDLAGELGEDEETVRRLLKQAGRLGHVQAVVPDRYFPHETVERLAAELSRLAAAHGEIDAAALRDALGVGRKLAIQILEFFDRSGYTRRLGDRHLLRDAGLF
ncbi:selenocysteine-specific translation elongation factor [Neisseriaceae bacterium JH1-16]|nr:selenocysteine-specific translation elongation factor [Neisseriaceae bacterium JH1-16]